MRITLEPPSGPPVFLCSGAAAGELPHDVSCDGSASILQSDYIAADAGDTESLGNRRRNVSFTVQRVHASEIAAQAFCLTTPRIVGAQGDLRFRITGAGGVVQEIFIRDAVLTSVRCQETGISSDTTYSLTGK